MGAVRMLIIALLGLYLGLRHVLAIVMYRNVSFVDINEDDIVTKNFNRKVVLVKTKLSFDKESKTFSYYAERKDWYYAIPSTFHVRTRDQFDSYEERANYTAPHGLAAIADWMVISQRDSLLGIYGTSLKPQVIFVHTGVFRIFVSDILPYLTEPFVLIQSGNDYTIPYNVDLRYGDFQCWDAWNKTLENKYLIRMYSENHVVTHPKVSTVHLGLSGLGRPGPDDRSSYPTDAKPFSERIHKLLVTDKIHNSHAQWYDRAHALEACLNHTDICDSTSKMAIIGNLVGHAAWLKTVSDYKFLVCTHGGGIDPAPKAIEAILVGTIPIIDRTANYDAYSLLPVAFVDSTVTFISSPNASAMMNEWSQRLGPHFENPHLRNVTLHRLSMAFWTKLVTSHIPDYRHGYADPNPANEIMIY
jgi:hypothetical protein